MIEIVLLQYLQEVLNIPVAMEKPAPIPQRYVLLERVGSGSNNRLSSATIAFQSHAESLYEAALLNDLVKEAVENSIVLNDISKVELNSDYNFTDTESKRYRYQAVFDIYHY